jgi:hypothetical protein
MTKLLKFALIVLFLFSLEVAYAQSGSGSGIRSTGNRFGLSRGVSVDRGDVEWFDFDLSNLTRDGEWHDLDLSGIVPIRARFVWVYAEHYASEGSWLLLRKKGNTGWATQYVVFSPPNWPASGMFKIAIGRERLIEYALPDNGIWLATNIVITGWEF